MIFDITVIRFYYNLISRSLRRISLVLVLEEDLLKINP